ncbi:DNA polymerase beta domain protein region [Ferroglobus placidus DSM 10642]|uniref:DNA polymerase beta domain protein region n=1 Tax=Ferroglobus placidus (strain DSM 10642 / AEDII12DO) TaxID=589924 RepID=D3S2Y1_FERPA|nr:nucleotidyltransferase domain-containing protein [Ferroglobus placidus]ADC64614.1 DNA polymerase beta domain protein region [Ferroglobus placidus DSM 10642]
MLEMERETLERFKKKVLNKLEDRVHAIVIYGSLARGTYTKDSDIDILVIGENKADWERVSRIAYEIDYENGFRTFITTMFLTKNEFEQRLKAGDPFIHNVLREGVVLYDTGVYEGFRKSMLEAR